MALETTFVVATPGVSLLQGEDALVRRYKIVDFNGNIVTPSSGTFSLIKNDTKEKIIDEQAVTLFETGQAGFLLDDTDTTNYEIGFYTGVFTLTLPDGSIRKYTIDVEVIDLFLNEYGITPQFIREKYLFGLDLFDDNGNEFPDSFFRFHIMSGIRTIERELDIDIIPHSYIDEPYDYYANDFEHWGWIQLKHFPVRQFNEMVISYPSNNQRSKIPNEWVQLRKKQGHLLLVPATGAFSNIITGNAGAFLLTMTNQYGYVPDLWRISYDTGFFAGELPYDLIDIIGMQSSLQFLMVAGDLLGGAGIASFSNSIDGISQSVSTTSSATNAGYGSRIIEYRKQLKTRLPLLKQEWKTIPYIAV